MSVGDCCETRPEKSAMPDPPSEALKLRNVSGDAFWRMDARETNRSGVPARDSRSESPTTGVSVGCGIGVGVLGGLTG